VLKLAPQHAWTADMVMHEPVNVEVPALWGWGAIGRRDDDLRAQALSTGFCGWGKFGFIDH
jgi:hypothetical protein